MIRYIGSMATWRERQSYNWQWSHPFQRVAMFLAGFLVIGLVILLARRAASGTPTPAGQSLNLGVFAWLMLAAFIACPVFHFVGCTSIRRRVRACNMRLCPRCRSDLRGLGDVGRCPQCARPFKWSELVRGWNWVIRDHRMIERALSDE